LKEVDVPDSMAEEMQRKGYKEPSAIQAQGWPIALSGMDLGSILRNTVSAKNFWDKFLSSNFG
jgi:superfamily II DNA/RNA helicase